MDGPHRDGTYRCHVHPDRVTQQRRCASAVRDDRPTEDVCTCCEECRAFCLTIPSDQEPERADR